eukprot:3455024-Heterocapsa_arctica.AAC.1
MASPAPPGVRELGPTPPRPAHVRERVRRAVAGWLLGPATGHGPRATGHGPRATEKAELSVAEVEGQLSGDD